MSVNVSISIVVAFRMWADFSVKRVLAALKRCSDALSCHCICLVYASSEMLLILLGKSSKQTSESLGCQHLFLEVLTHLLVRAANVDTLSQRFGNFFDWFIFYSNKSRTFSADVSEFPMLNMALQLTSQLRSWENSCVRSLCKAWLSYISASWCSQFNN